MLFRSTRRSTDPVTVSAAIERGLAPDGGLYVPEEFPAMPRERFEGLESVAAIAARLLEPFFAGDPLEQHLDQVCREALNFPIPLRPLPERTSLLELFHGPTAAFKDVGARFLAACMTRLATGRKRTILVATSGDTGSAIAAAFHGLPGFEVLILFPDGGVSARQQHQLTCWGDNVRAFAVRGVFDDCQKLVKEAFADEKWRTESGLTSANSINVGRLLPQASYYAAASLWYGRSDGVEPDFIVPSGNVGNACAAFWARAMGLPLGRILMSNNANRVVTDYFLQGEWNPRPSVPTLANAMDVGNPSNMERIFDLFGTADELRKVSHAAAYDDATIRETIAAGPRRWQVVFCPHTATGLRYREEHPEGHAVVVATAHPAKFETVVEPLVEHEVPLPPSLRELMRRPAEHLTIDPRLSEFKQAARSAWG